MIWRSDERDDIRGAGLRLALRRLAARVFVHTTAVAIHSADGTPIGAAPTADLAIAAIIQNEMEPVLVH